jgi:membrane protein
MFRRIVGIAKSSISIFSNAGATGRGAAIAFYTVTSLAPILLIVVAVAALAFGREAASTAIIAQFKGLLGDQGGELVQKALETNDSKSEGVLGSIIGVVLLLVTASGVFLELEDALNAIWKAKKKAGLKYMARARAASAGLVIALGFLLLVSLAVDAGLKSLGGTLDALLPGGKSVVLVLSTIISFCVLSVVFAAIMKYLPAKHVAWREVAGGAVFTAFLFEIGKALIGLFLAKNSAVSALGAAGSLIALLFWVYYTAQIFLFGACVTRAYARSLHPDSAEDDQQKPRPLPRAAAARQR